MQPNRLKLCARTLSVASRLARTSTSAIAAAFARLILACFGLYCAINRSIDVQRHGVYQFFAS
jgi:hypothetical protein